MTHLPKPMLILTLAVAFFPTFHTQFIRDVPWKGPWDFLNTIQWYDKNPDLSSKNPWVFKHFDEIQLQSCLKFRKEPGWIENASMIAVNFQPANTPNLDGCPDNVLRQYNTSVDAYIKDGISYKDSLHLFVHWLAIGDSNLRSIADQYLERTNNKPAWDLGQLKFQDYTETPVPYDVGGIMHMPCDETTQCRPKDRNKMFSVGNNMLTFSDIRLINMAYGCHWTCGVDDYQRCYQPNRGLPNPRDCSKCLCPDGFEGPECTDRRKALGSNGECGSTLTATYKMQTLKINLPKPASEGKPNVCIYHIQAPPGKQVVVLLDKFNNEGPSATASSDQACIKHCMESYVEVQTERFDLAGPRYCCRYAHLNNKIGELKSKNGLIIIKVNSYRENTHAEVRFKLE
uniref:CUB domain-containing protein n=1 Tax=Panagrellus redivivus TaxID=6233 RepID=A0A7E4ZZT5_PANRE